MNDDQYIKSLINFLLPIIFLYGMYFLSDLFRNAGFFAIIYYAVLMVNGVLIYEINNNQKYKTSTYVDIFSFAFSLISIVYLIAIICLITDMFFI